MKRYNNLYDEMISINNINKVYYKQIRVNTKNKVKIYKFEQFYTLNVSKIKSLLENDNYEIGKYNIFLIKDPKYRIIMSQKIKDKLINHLVGNVLIHVLDRTLINTNVATRKGKGTHFGIKYLKKYLSELKGEEVYALKFDISKYFYNIDHDILKKLYCSKIKDKRFLNLLDKIINSTTPSYINKKINTIISNEINKINKSNINKKEKHKKINELKSIPLYKTGKGLPIGNLTSQILAIFYLNELDHFILEKLKAKYIRYMDDGVLLSNNKDYLKCCLKEIIKILTKYSKSNLKVIIHENINDEKTINYLRDLNKIYKRKYHIYLSLEYTQEYLDNNIIRQTIVNTLRVCGLIISSLVILVITYIGISNYVALEEDKEVKNNLANVIDNTNNEEIKEAIDKKNNDNLNEAIETNIPKDEVKTITNIIDILNLFSTINSLFETLNDDLETFATYSVYIVREGDTIDSILERYKVTREDLMEYNNLEEVTLGSKLVIPANSKNESV